MATRKKKQVLGLALDRTEDVRLANIVVPNPAKSSRLRLGQRPLPELPAVASRIRKTAGTLRGAR
jgi:hypothetical protein